MSNISQDCIVIIPTYNEVDAIGALIESIFRSFPAISVLIVDDNSPDGTADVIKDRIYSYENLHLISRESKLGLGSAYRAGFIFAMQNKYEYAIQMDADGSHQVSNLSSLIYAPKNIDLVIGSRYVSGGGIIGWSTRRKLISSWGNRFARFMLKIKIKDTTSGFKRLSKKVYSENTLVNSKTNGYAFQIEIANYVHRKSLPYLETPITFIDRRFGSSKMSKKIIFEAFFSVINWSKKNKKSNQN
jgi:dolichol-phosphate mannosyltransferase